MTDNELIISSYKAALKDLRKRYKDMDPEHPDKKTISGMISNMEYSLFWLKNGHERPPVNPISKLSYEQRTIYVEDISIMEYIPGTTFLVGDELKNSDMDASERYLIHRSLEVLSHGERASFLEIYANGHSYTETAELYNVSRGSIQKNIIRAKEKIETMLEFENTEICLFA